MPLPEFEYHEPTTVAEACELLAQDPAGSAVFAGGTDVIVSLKEGLAAPRHVVSLRGIPGLKAITCSDSGSLVIPAMATVNQLARNREVGRLFPGLHDAALSLADEQIRNLATVGGNLCSAVPSADMAPILLALGARVRIASTTGERVVALAHFFTGPRATVLAAGEVLTAIEVPAPARCSGSASLRRGGREALSLPFAIAAAVVEMYGEVVNWATVALGAVAPTPIIAPEAGACLVGRPLDAETLERAGRLAAEASRPIDDLRASKAYRLELLAVLTRRAIVSAARRAGGK